MYFPGKVCLLLYWSFYEINNCSVALREGRLYPILYNLDDKCKVKDRFFSFHSLCDVWLSLRRLSWKV